MSGYKVSSSIIENTQALEQEWCDLQERADCSYFQSWGWIGTWLKQIASGFQPRVVRVCYNSKLVGLGVFVPRDIRRRVFVRSRALFLNEYPFDGRNMVIEYNGILSEPAHLGAVYAEVSSHLFGADSRLDEVFFSGVDAGAAPLEKRVKSGRRQEKIKSLLLEESSTWAVDLDSIGAGRDAWLDMLSKNRRAQIRRSFRLYEKSGTLRLEAAEDLDTALEYFSGLKKLHTLRWQKEGKPGTFSNRLWEDFHRSLIKSGFGAGEIQLLRVRNDSTVIGYLYNLVWRKHVYVLQTGFEVEREKGLMPGYVVHAMAIEHNRQLGMAWYDLMHGDELYKKILCSQYRELQWVALQRRRLRFGLENFLLAVKRRCMAA